MSRRLLTVEMAPRLSRGYRVAAAQGGGGLVGHGYTVTHYADSAASGGGDGSVGNPWTPSEAMANATQGDVVEFASGTMTVTNSSMGLHPANSGTSSEPIIFVAKYPAVHNLDNSAAWTQVHAAGSGSRHCISNNILTGGNRQYIVFDGFRTYQGVDNAFDGGGHHVALHNNSSTSQFWKFRRMLLDQENYAPGGSVAALGGDNYGGFWTQGTENVEISDCIIRRFYGAGPNLTAWTLYGARNNRMHHCLIEDVSNGGYVKGNQASGWNSPLRVDHNIYRNMKYAFMVLNVVGEVDGTPFADIYQNIFIAESGYIFGFRSPGAPSSDNPRSLRVVNNTCIGESGCELIGHSDGLDCVWFWPSITATDDCGTEVYFRNNILNCATQVVRYMAGSQAGDDTGLARIDSDRNLLSASMEDQFAALGTTSKANWTTASGREGNSEFGTADFVDAANDDYTLDTGSPGIDIGTDILNLLGGGTSADINAGAVVGDGSTFGVRSAAVINASSFVWSYPFV